ncbi:energy transducer TonB [Echinicola jeungdonensis]|uniref:Energy transducer TonB n=1 Tax=Echinicola jeungdonensis TaxID=709343 RepID=A0ABV5J779_9BACT|nr:energy transducer TonB [Echinicola jeungdonensis]MDN3670876.1 energy transducer TonB [Echinicola jeungdonensis]
MQLEEVNKEELKSKKKAAIITIIINVLVLVGIYFIVVWRPPVPPIPKFGLQLNLGFTEVGSGNRQTETPPSENKEATNENPSPGAPEQVAEPVKTEAVPKSQPEAQPEPTPTKSALETKSNVASPLEGKEKTSESTKENQKPEVNKQPETQPKEEKSEKVEEKPKIDERAIFGAGGNQGNSNQASTGSSQGTTTQKGDEGKSTGTIDGRAVMKSGNGNAGQGAGYNLDLAGWDFANKPNIQDNVSNRNGKIVFKIVVDDNGRVVQAIPLEYNVNNEVLSYYRGVVNKLTFKRQSGNPAADYSEGKITFIIKVD